MKTGDKNTRANVVAPTRTPPPGFVSRVRGAATLMVLHEWEKELISSGILTGGPDSPAMGQTELPGGRGSASALTLPGIGALVLRRYRRGGLIGKILFDRYLSGTRPFRELGMLVLARSHGVPVPEAIGASSVRAGLLWHRGRIVTRLIPDSRTLPVFMKEERKDGRRVAAVLKKAGAAVRKMHQATIDHADLNMNNILVDTDNNVFIIDFDKATAHTELYPRRRIRNLRRLLRSARKLAGRGLPFADGDFETILKGYCGRDEQLIEIIKDSTIRSHKTALRGFLSRLMHRFV